MGTSAPFTSYLLGGAVSGAVLALVAFLLSRYLPASTLCG